MEQSRLINVSGYLASGLSCALLVAESNHHIASTALASSTSLSSSAVLVVPGSMAYLPWVASVLLAGDHWFAMLQASVVAFGIPFLATLLSATWKSTTAPHQATTTTTTTSLSQQIIQNGKPPQPLSKKDV